MRRSRGSTAGSARATLRNSSASSTSSSSRQPLLTVRRTRVVSMSVTLEALEVFGADVGGAAKGLAVLDALQQMVGQAAGVAAALDVPVDGHEWRLGALLDPILELLQQAGLAHAPGAHHPQRVTIALQDLGQDPGAAEEVLAPDPAAGDEGVTHGARAAKGN